MTPDQRATTEIEWQRQLKKRVRKWVSMRAKSGERAKVYNLGPMPLPPISLVEYYTRNKRED
jgi:hypothetical protein